MELTINNLKIYTPAKDFDLSRRFYTAMGFKLTEAWGGSVDCKLGNAEFRLQNYYAKEWAENFMMQFWVDDIEAWYAHAKDVVDTGEFGAAIKGLETVDGSMLFHVWDPSGILLIFIK